MRVHARGRGPRYKGNMNDCIKVICCVPSFYQCIPLPTECLVGLGYYTPNGTNSCRPCTVCNANQGVRSPCTETNDTDCEDCAEGTYSKVISSGRTCYPCTVCAQEGKREVSPCSATDDSICGECALGIFCTLTPGVVNVRCVHSVHMTGSSFTGSNVLRHTYHLTCNVHQVQCYV